MTTPFKPGDRLVHPTLGPCTLAAITEKSIGGQMLSVAVLVDDESRSQTLIPLEKVASAGLTRAGEVEEAPEHVDPVLGRFTWSEKFGGWQRSETTSQAFELLVIADELTEPAVLFAKVRAAAKRVVESVDLLRAGVASKLLELHNRTWNQSGVPETRDGFASRIQLRSLEVHPDGTATAYFDDGDLFWGHTIEARVNAEGKVESAHPAG